MNCHRCKELMWAYLSQELDKEEAVFVAAHLKDCPDCQEETEKLQELMDSLSNLPEEDLPEGYHTELIHKLAQQEKILAFPSGKKPQYFWKQFGLIAAGVVLVVAIGGTQGILKMRGEGNGPSEKIFVQETTEPEDISEIFQSAAPQEDALPEEPVLEKSAHAGVEEGELQKDVRAEQPKIQKKMVSEEAPQEEITNGSSPQKEDISQEQAQKQEKVEISLPEAPIPDLAQAEPRDMLFAVEDTREALPMQQVILTVGDTEGVLDSIGELAISLGGYEEFRPSAQSIRISVPAGKRENFMEGIKEIGETRSLTENIETMDMVVFEITVETN